MQLGKLSLFELKNGANRMKEEVENMNENYLVCHEKRFFSSGIDFTGVNFQPEESFARTKKEVSLTCTS